MLMVAAKELRVGDLVDLSNDEFGRNMDGARGGVFESEYAEIASIEVETPECVRVNLEGFNSVGMPPEHRVPVAYRAAADGFKSRGQWYD